MDNKKTQKDLILDQNPKRSEDIKPVLPKTEQPGLNKSGKQILPRN